MKKSTKGEVVLSACQIQATRLNKLEYRRLERNVNLLREDLQNHIARIHRQEQGLRYHFTNVVRVVKPNRAYQAWKLAHKHEIEQDQESTKLEQKLNLTARQRPVSSVNEVSSQSLRPLLLLLDNTSEKKSTEPLINLTESFLRPKTSPMNQNPPIQHRINPLITMLNGSPNSSANQSRQQPQPFESPSFYSLSSMATTGSRKLVQGKFVNTHKAADLDAFYRMALQNQTAYQSVDQTRIDRRKLLDKEFASQHRALKGSIRSSGVTN